MEEYAAAEREAQLETLKEAGELAVAAVKGA